MKKVISRLIITGCLLLLFGCPAPGDSASDTFSITANFVNNEPGDSLHTDITETTAGTTVTVTATLNNGRQVTISSTETDFSQTIITSNGGAASFTMPAQDVEITATFSDIPATIYDISISSNQAESGESVSMDIPEAEEGENVTLTAVLNIGRQVTFSATGVLFSPTVIISNDGSTVFSMPAHDVEITATFSDIPATSYAVTVNSNGAESGESVTADVSTAGKGDTITLTAALNSERQVSLSATGVTIDPVSISTNNGTASFTMPANAVEITAMFSDVPVATYPITISSIGAESGESVTANVSSAAEGTTVTLTAALNNGRMATLSCSDATINPSSIVGTGDSTEFRMPAHAIEVIVLFDNINHIGDIEIIYLGLESFKMIYVNDYSSITFPIGISDDDTASLTTNFWMAETEITNATIAIVLQWAYNNGLFSTNVDNHNGIDSTIVKYGNQNLLVLSDLNCHIKYNDAGIFTVDSGYENYPVTNITWYGAIMCCNWLTEMKDGNSLNVVYSNIDEDWTHDETLEDVEKSGYRLPSSNEWEYSARYNGTDTTNTVSSTINYIDFSSMPIKWTKGNSASGTTTFYNDVQDLNGNSIADSKDENDAVAIYRYYYDGSWIDKGTADEAEVKSLGVNSSNALGLYDMSGNVYEWCFTKNESICRTLRGGAWDNYAFSLQVGSWLSGHTPNISHPAIGFRLCRTAD